MNLAEVVICEIQGDRSLKVFKLFTESVREAREPTAVHSQRVILLFNVRRANAAHVRHSANDCLLSFYHFRRTVSASGILGEVDE